MKSKLKTKKKKFKAAFLQFKLKQKSKKIHTSISMYVNYT
jgi:hypothetical protein